MKKIFTLLLSIGSFTAVFAQSGRYNDKDNNVYTQRNNEVVMNNDHGRNYGNANVYNYPQPAPRGMDDKGHQQDMDRRNGDYGRRGNDYGHGQPQPPYERDRRINDVQRNNQRGNNGSFVKGAVIGGVAGVLLGVLLSK